MFEWLTEPTNTALVLVIVSIMGLVGGSFSAGGVTFNLTTAKGQSYFFVILVGMIGLFIILFDFIYSLE